MTAEWWPAPTAGPLDATITVPGSKSLTNRLLVLAALADGPSTLVGALRARDTELMASALAALGARVDFETDLALVTPGPIRSGGRIDCGLAGTVMRFAPPVAALGHGATEFDGDPEARRRPLEPLLAALASLGVRVAPDGARSLPFTIVGAESLPGGRVEMDASSSSQFVSGLLLAGSRADGPIEIVHRGAAPPSTPHIEMTCETIAAYGGTATQVETGPDAWSWRVEPAALQGQETRIEPDLSNAGPFLAAALAAGGTVRVPGWPSSTTQAGDALRWLLAKMGAQVRLEASSLSVTGPDRIAPIDVDMSTIGELAPTIAALAALADGSSRLTGLAHLRGHETDRLAALATELAKVGCAVGVADDGLTIAPGRLHGADLESYHDHRMATFGAILGLRVPGMRVRDIGTTAKTLPGFERMWTAMTRG